MGNILKNNFDLIKRTSISSVLECIRAKGPISRADIAEKIDLTPPTITRITKELIKDGFVEQAGLGESSGGRPPVLLKLNPKAGYIVGVNLGPGILELVMTDLEANIFISKSEELKDKKEAYVIDKLIFLVKKIIAESKVEADDIIGIGIAVHGLVDSKEGISIFAPYYNWRQVAIKELVEEEFGLPTFIDNDVRAMALGESWFGITKNVKDFVTINVSNGIGSGIVIDGKLHYGSNYSAGEIGHTIVDINGPKCDCGNYGCLTELASNSKIIKEAKKLIRQGVETEVYDLIAGDLDKLTVKIICQAANKGDDMSQQILKEAGIYLGIGISYLLNILNPKMIVFVGEITEAKEYFFKGIEDVIVNRALDLPVENVKITATNLGENAATIGGATLVLQELFKIV